MCGATSAIGLGDEERALWPALRERLRMPGHVMGLMRAVLGGDAEVGTLIATTPDGHVKPLAVLVTPMIEAELDLPEYDDDARQVPGHVGDYDVDVLLDRIDGRTRPVALLLSPWIFQHLALYARRLWYHL